jgi:hypothetical protein
MYCTGEQLVCVVPGRVAPNSSKFALARCFSLRDNHDQGIQQQRSPAPATAMYNQESTRVVKAATVKPSGALADNNAVVFPIDPIRWRWLTTPGAAADVPVLTSVFLGDVSVPVGKSRISSACYHPAADLVWTYTAANKAVQK